MSHCQYMPCNLYDCHGLMFVFQGMLGTATWRKTDGEKRRGDGEVTRIQFNYNTEIL